MFNQFQLEELNLYFPSVDDPYPKDIPGLLEAIAKGPKGEVIIIILIDTVGIVHCVLIVFILHF